jgi:translation elongation factor EF-Tu-like GTPase
MIDPALLPAFFSLFGQTGGALLRRAAEKHVEGYFGKALERVAGIGRKSAFEEAVRGALERAAGAWIEAVLKNLAALGYDAGELEPFKSCFGRLLDDEEVGRELSRPLLDGEEWTGADVQLFQDAWVRLGCQPLPAEFRWLVAIGAFERQLRKQQLLTPELRDLLNAGHLAAIRVELGRLVGARPEANERRYAARMREKYGDLRLAAFAPAEEEVPALQVQDLFLPQDVRENPPPIELPWDLRRRLAQEGDRAEAEWRPPEELAPERLERARLAYVEQPRRPVLAALAEPSSRRTVLLGDPGSGKSTLAQYLLLSLLHPPHGAREGRGHGWIEAFSGHLPLLIELREFIAERSRDRCGSFIEFLHLLGQTQGYALEETWLAERLRGGPSLVLFDGLDEIFDGAERERVQHEIAGFCADHPHATVIVTSRPAGYIGTILRAAGFRHFALQELDESQVARFTRLWFATVLPREPEEADRRVNRVLEACRRSPSIRLLASNPLLLTIMAMIARRRELPRERARFYDASVEVLCHHWDVNRHLALAGLQLDLDLDDKKELLRRVAFRMQAARQGLSGNFLHGDDLRAELKDFLASDGKRSPGQVRSIAHALIDQLHSRNYILCLYGPDLFGFVHRTFLEYFCADELRRRVHEITIPGYSIERLLQEEVARHWRDPAWEEVLRLLCGMIGEAHAGRIIGYLTAEASPNWKDFEEHYPLHHLLLAMLCLAEVKHRHLIAPVCQALLQAILSALEFPLDDLRMDRDLTRFPEAIAEIGGDWPGGEWLRAGFPAAIHRMLPDVLRVRIYLELALSLLGSEDRERREVEGLVEDESFTTRMAALDVLARFWPQELSVRELLERRALEDESPWPRQTALEALAWTWPQERSVRELLERRALLDEDPSPRRTALEALVRIWPQEPSVRELLEHRALQDEAPGIRGTALEALAQSWPQERSVRELLEQRALHDEAPGTRDTALRALAGTWPQERSVRELLEQRALQDEDRGPRHTALAALARTWPQEPSVRDLLQQRALQDEDPGIRNTALEALARTWPQERSVRELLEQRALQDEDPWPRGTALAALLRTWPQDRSVRELLEQRALHEEDPRSRGAALAALAQTCPQERSVRELLELVALQDEDPWARGAALEAMAQTWPQESSVRELLEQRARQDEDPWARGTALDTLAWKWPQERSVRELLERRALQDDDPGARGRALDALARMWPQERSVHELLVMLSRDLDGRRPFLDPRRPVSPEHRQGAASRLGISISAVDDRLAGCS